MADPSRRLVMNKKRGGATRGRPRKMQPQLTTIGDTTFIENFEETSSSLDSSHSSYNTSTVFTVTPTSSVDCRRSTRKKVTKFEVLDLLHKPRKTPQHKIQIEARIDSNVPSTMTLATAPLSSASSTLASSVSMQKINKQQQNGHHVAVSAEEDSIKSAERRRGSVVPDTKKSFQDVFNAKVIKSKPKSSLIVAQLSTPKAGGQGVRSVAPPEQQLKRATVVLPRISDKSQQPQLRPQVSKDLKQIVQVPQATTIKRRGRPPKNKPTVEVEVNPPEPVAVKNLPQEPMRTVTLATDFEKFVEQLENANRLQELENLGAIDNNMPSVSLITSEKKSKPRIRLQQLPNNESQNEIVYVIENELDEEDPPQSLQEQCELNIINDRMAAPSQRPPRTYSQECFDDYILEISSSSEDATNPPKEVPTVMKSFAFFTDDDDALMPTQEEEVLSQQDFVVGAEEEILDESFIMQLEEERVVNMAAKKDPVAVFTTILNDDSISGGEYSIVSGQKHLVDPVVEEEPEEPKAELSDSVDYVEVVPILSSTQYEEEGQGVDSESNNTIDESKDKEEKPSECTMATPAASTMVTKRRRGRPPKKKDALNTGGTNQSFEQENLAANESGVTQTKRRGRGRKKTIVPSSTTETTSETAQGSQNDVIMQSLEGEIDPAEVTQTVEEVITLGFEDEEVVDEFEKFVEAERLITPDLESQADDEVANSLEPDKLIAQGLTDLTNSVEADKVITQELEHQVEVEYEESVETEKVIAQGIEDQTESEIAHLLQAEEVVTQVLEDQIESEIANSVEADTLTQSLADLRDSVKVENVIAQVIEDKTEGGEIVYSVEANKVITQVLKDQIESEVVNSVETDKEVIQGLQDQKDDELVYLVEAGLASEPTEVVETSDEVRETPAEAPVVSETPKDSHSIDEILNSATTTVNRKSPITLPPKKQASKYKEYNNIDVMGNSVVQHINIETHTLRDILNAVKIIEEVVAQSPSNESSPIAEESPHTDKQTPTSQDALTKDTTPEAPKPIEQNEIPLSEESPNHHNMTLLAKEDSSSQSQSDLLDSDCVQSPMGQEATSFGSNCFNVQALKKNLRQYSRSKKGSKEQAKEESSVARDLPSTSTLNGEKPKTSEEIFAEIAAQSARQILNEVEDENDKTDDSVREVEGENQTAEGEGQSQEPNGESAVTENVPTIEEPPTELPFGDKQIEDPNQESKDLELESKDFEGKSKDIEEEATKEDVSQEAQKADDSTVDLKDPVIEDNEKSDTREYEVNQESLTNTNAGEAAHMAKVRKKKPKDKGAEDASDCNKSEKLTKAESPQKPKALDDSQAASVEKNTERVLEVTKGKAATSLFQVNREAQEESEGGELHETSSVTKQAPNELDGASQQKQGQVKRGRGRPPKNKETGQGISKRCLNGEEIVDKQAQLKPKAKEGKKQDKEVNCDTSIEGVDRSGKPKKKGRSLGKTLNTEEVTKRSDARKKPKNIQKTSNEREGKLQVEHTTERQSIDANSISSLSSLSSSSSSSKRKKRKGEPEKVAEVPSRGSLKHKRVCTYLDDKSPQASHEITSSPSCPSTGKKDDANQKTPSQKHEKDVKGSQTSLPTPKEEQEKDKKDIGEDGKSPSPIVAPPTPAKSGFLELEIITDLEKAKAVEARAKKKRQKRLKEEFDAVFKETITTTTTSSTEIMKEVQEKDKVPLVDNSLQSPKPSAINDVISESPPSFATVSEMPEECSHITPPIETLPFVSRPLTPPDLPPCGVPTLEEQPQNELAEDKQPQNDSPPKEQPKVESELTREGPSKDELPDAVSLQEPPLLYASEEPTTVLHSCLTPTPTESSLNLCTTPTSLAGSEPSKDINIRKGLSSHDEMFDPLRDIEKFIADGVSLLKSSSYSIADGLSDEDTRESKQDADGSKVEPNQQASEETQLSTTNLSLITYETPADTPMTTPNVTPPISPLPITKATKKSGTTVRDEGSSSAVRRSHRIKKKVKAPKGRGLVRDPNDTARSHYNIDDHLMDLAEVEAKNAKFLKVMEQRLNNFQVIKENVYLCERAISKEALRMLCDCFLTPDEESRGEWGCGEDCLNRLLMIECGPDCNVGRRCTNRRFQRLLCSPCRVFRTEKKGFGIMADAVIEAGEFIMEYVGEVINTDEFERRRILYSKDKNRHYYFMALRSDAIIDATVKGNISRFINHSCDPNAETQKWTVNGEIRIGFFSRKVILPGDEITFDYKYERYGREAQRCYCESSNCRGWIGQAPDSDEGEQLDDEEDFVYDPDDDDSSDIDPEDVQKRLEEAAAKADLATSVPSYSAEGNKKTEVADKEVVGGGDLEAEAEGDDMDTKFKKLLAKISERRGQNKVGIIPLKEKKRRRKRSRKTRWDNLSAALQDDPDIEHEVNSLYRSGLKNQVHTLRFSRLMVRTKVQQTRLKLLEILRRADAPCKRLFLDYHGLRLLHGWMAEDGDLLEMRLAILKTLEQLDLKNKTILVDSKVLSSVKNWRGETDGKSSGASLSPPTAEDSSAKENTGETVHTEVSADGAVAPVDSKPVDNVLRLEVEILAAKLFAHYESLPEVFRIPKRERIEQMKEHEREANRQFEESSSAEKPNVEIDTELNKSRDPYHRDRFGRDRVSNNFKFNPREFRPVDRLRRESNAVEGLPGAYTEANPYKHLTKEQHRELFAARHAQREAEKRMHEQRRMFEMKCLYFGLDPMVNTYDQLPYCVEVETKTWYNEHREILPTPPTFINAALPAKPKSTNPDDYELPEEAKNLPGDWKFGITTQGYIYYYNVESGISQWEAPTIKQMLNLPDGELERCQHEQLSDTSDDGAELFGMDEDGVNAYVTRKIQKRKMKRKMSLVEERSISPRREEDRIYNQNEVRKYKENKEKIRKRKEELRKRRAEMAKSAKPIEVVTTATKEDSTQDPLSLPIPDYLLSSDDEEGLQGSNDDSSGNLVGIRIESTDNPLLDKIVDEHNIVDELEALQTKRPLKRPLPIHRDVESSLAEEKEASEKPEKIAKVNMAGGLNNSQYSKPVERVAPSTSSIFNVEKAAKKDKNPSTSASSAVPANKKPSKEAEHKYKKIREKFRCEIAGIIVNYLKPYRSKKSRAHIQSDEDFNHLARKLTHFVMIKEMKYCESVGQTLVVTESVKNKSKEFIKKYMSKYGEVYVKPKDDPEFKEIPIKL